MLKISVHERMKSRNRHQSRYGPDGIENFGCSRSAVSTSVTRRTPGGTVGGGSELDEEEVLAALRLSQHPESLGSKGARSPAATITQTSTRMKTWMERCGAKIKKDSTSQIGHQQHASLGRPARHHLQQTRIHRHPVRPLHRRWTQV